MFWFARDSASLIIARVLQGLSAAVVWTVGLTLVVDTVGKSQTGVAMGYVSAGQTVGMVSGPFIGGILWAVHCARRLDAENADPSR